MSPHLTFLFIVLVLQNSSISLQSMALGAYNFGNILKETNAEGSEKFDMGIKVSFLLPLEIQLK